MKKPLTAFSKDGSRGSGLAIWCKVCAAEKSRAWFKANPEKNFARSKAWVKANPEKQKAKAKKRRDRQTKGLARSYVARLLAANTSLLVADISLELIEAKRQQILLLRAGQAVKTQLKKTK